MKYLKSATGKILGRIMESDNNIQKGYTATGRYVGKYQESNDTTYGYTGKIVGKGNQLSKLILDA